MNHSFRLTFSCLASFMVLFVGVAADARVGLPELDKLAKSGLKVSALFSVDGKAVAELNPDSRVNPASVTKLFTAAVALKVLGADRRMNTVVYRTADNRLVIEGAGDPELTSRHLDELAACVASKTAASKASGGKSPAVFSKLVFSTGPFTRDDLPPGYSQKETQAAYRAAVAGLQIDRNAIVVSVSKADPGKTPEVTVSPMSDYVRISNKAVASAAGKAGTAERKKDPLAVSVTTDSSGRLLVDVTGKSNPKKRVATTWRVDNPAWNAAATFVEALRNHDVKVKTVVPERGPTPAGAEKLCVRPSPALRDIVVPMLKESINPIAESLLRLTGAQTAALNQAALSAVSSGAPSDDQAVPVGFAEGAAILKEFMLSDVAASPESFEITNGSGLYGANSVSAAAVVKLISWILDNPQMKKVIRDALPVGGRDGTLKNRFKEEPLKNRIRAKTGTLDEAVSLAGWVEVPDGKELSFAILVEGDGKLDAKKVRKAVDSSVVEVFRAMGQVSTPARGGGQSD